jgi:hypothetical protein
MRTGAHPDFLLRAAGDGHVCGSPQREPHALPQHHHSQQEIRASAVERSAVSSCGAHTHAEAAHPSPTTRRMRHPSIGVAGGGVSSQRITGIADHAGMKRGVVLPSSPPPTLFGCPTFAPAYVGLPRRGEVPSKVCLFSSPSTPNLWFDATDLFLLRNDTFAAACEAALPGSSDHADSIGAFPLVAARVFM